MNQTAYATLCNEPNLRYFFNYVISIIQNCRSCLKVNLVFGPVNIRQYWVMVATDIKHYKIHVFHSMSNYNDQTIVDGVLQTIAHVIPSLIIMVGLDTSPTRFHYSLWLVNKIEDVFQYRKLLDCAIVRAKVVEYLVCNSLKDCLNKKNMKLFRQQYVAKLWANKYIFMVD